MTELPPFRPVPFAPLDIDVETRADGTRLMRSRLELNLRQTSLPAYLAHHARLRPDRRWLAQRTRDGNGWDYISFGQAKERVDSLTQALADLRIPHGASLFILSGNSIEHALIMLAAMQAGLPVVPVSPAYSMMSQDLGKLKELATTVTPGAVFVQDGQQFAAAASAIGSADVTIIAVHNVQNGQLSLADLLQTSGRNMADSHERIRAETVAKIMFTSGSTGSPKGVPLTHEALVIAGESNLTVTGALEEGKKTRLDWAPWSHVFGATTLSLSIIEGGSFYIDGGRPLPKLFDETLRNLAEVQPDLFMNVPAAISMLVEAMEKDDALANSILEKLVTLGYGGAALPEDIVHRFQALAVRYTGHRITISCGYGATETGPGGGFVYWLTEQTGTLGLPHPGFAMKLVPFDTERYEVRILSKAVTSGYLGRPDLNETIFDEEGYYRTGDTVVFSTPEDPLSGLIFAGRLNEEFKLQSGTFVRVGALRAALMEATAPLLRDVVICGESRPYLGLLGWPHPDPLLPGPDGAEQYLSALKQKIAAYNAANPGSSSAIRVFRLLKAPPSLDHGEVTDKGSINQRAVQRRRADEVAALFDQPRPNDTFEV